jgi:hypothetical protein
MSGCVDCGCRRDDHPVTPRSSGMRWGKPWPGGGVFEPDEVVCPTFIERDMPSRSALIAELSRGMPHSYTKH